MLILLPKRTLGHSGSPWFNFVSENRVVSALALLIALTGSFQAPSAPSREVRPTKGDVSASVLQNRARAEVGFLANRFRTRNLQLCRDLLAVRPSTSADSPNGADTNIEDRPSCPICKLGRLIVIEILHPERPVIQNTS
jgi:hypothetical protein